MAKKLRKGVRLTSPSKTIIECVRKFFEKKRVTGHTIKRTNVLDLTAQATGVSRRTIARIQKEFISCDSQLLTPLKRYVASCIRVNPDSFDKEVIRRVVHGFYERKEYPTLSGVLRKVKDQCGFPGGRFCMWRVLQELGFSYKKRDNKQFIYEQQNIVEQRHTYLRTIRKLRNENNYDLIYTDETWVNAHHTNEYIWFDSDGKGGWKVPSGKGQRLIVLHAGGVEGWVEGAILVFRSKTNSADYHDEMNSQHYMEWLTGQLLPVLDKPTVIILDNASYHNKQDKPPTSNDRKDDIRKWLDEHNIQYSQTDIEKTLLQLVKQHRPAPLYLTDEAIHNMGHTVLRLPVAHCELKPIEVWASVKGYVAKHNRDYTFAEVERLTPEGLKHTTTEMWRHFCRHVVDVENEYFEKDGIVEDVVEEMIIAVGDDSDEEVEEEDDMEDDDDRQLIGMTLRQSTSTDGPSTSTNGQSTPTRQSTFTDRSSTSTGQSTPTQTTCTNPRQNLSELLGGCPTSGMIPSPHCRLPGPAP